MKEKLMGVLLIIFLILVLIKVTMIVCGTESVEKSDVFVTIESHASYSIMYDKETRVIYAVSRSGSRVFSPLYNADGTLKLYKENDDE